MKRLGHGMRWKINGPKRNRKGEETENEKKTNTQN
jgi:hypothetical protein